MGLKQFHHQMISLKTNTESILQMITKESTALEFTLLIMLLTHTNTNTL